MEFTHVPLRNIFLRDIFCFYDSGELFIKNKIYSHLYREFKNVERSLFSIFPIQNVLFDIELRSIKGISSNQNQFF